MQRKPRSVTEYPNEKGPLVIIASATGVKKEFYTMYSLYLQQYAFVVTFDYTGIGESLDVLKTIKADIKQWGVDTRVVVEYYKALYPSREIVYIGHSVGGHLLGFVGDAVSRALFISVNSAYYRHVRKPGACLFYPYALMSKWTLGYFNAQFLQLGENLPSDVGLQWAYWGLYKEYMKHNPKTAEQYNKIKLPIVSLYYPDDEIAIKSGFEWAAYEMIPNSINSLYKIDKKGGHFGFFKPQAKDVWNGVLPFILEGQFQPFDGLEYVPPKTKAKL